MTLATVTLAVLATAAFASNARVYAGHTPMVRRAYYADGAPRYRRTYLDGYEDGTHLGWWSDGTPHFVYHYVHGRLEGEAREWFANGRLYRDFHYRHGQEEGREQMWYADGTLRANYVMRSGRRYGLPGTKGCVDTTTNGRAAE
ncbi:MAG TPA: hypothetical protein VHW65_13085 [Gemmatimonadales bacterium]|jgi:hypothetical protein|nr:hypothetical protein [Gemmatimonadales bacterium]